MTASKQHTGNLELFKLKCRKACIHIQERLNEDLPVLLNRECECTSPGPTFCPTSQLEEVLGRNNDFWISLKVDKLGDKGTLLIHLPFPLGIAFSGTLFMMADSRIRERIEEGSVTDEDLDVLYEVGNQLRGGLMRSLRKTAHHDVHLSLDYVIQHGGPPERFASGAAVVVPITIRIPRLLADRFEVLADLLGMASLLRVEVSQGEIREMLGGEPTPEAQPVPDSRASDGGPQVTGKKAAIIEGTPEAGPLRSAVENLGYALVEYESVQSLTDQLRNGQIHLIVIDSGDDVVKALRLAQLLRSFSRNCKIFVGARQWRKEQIYQGVRAGVDGFLTKPYDPETLRQKLPPVVDTEAARAAEEPSLV